MFPLRLFRFLSSQSTIRCWRCDSNHDISSLFCLKCNFLQHPTTGNSYFKIIGVKQQYTIDLKDLTNKFRKLQSLLHPDKFSNKDDKEKKISEEYSSLVNKAYSTLQQPLSRGIYLLELNEVTIDESNVQNNPEFLMSLMELNEEVESAEDQNSLNIIAKNNQIKMEKLTKKISDAFNANNIEIAKGALIEMKYYSSVDSKIRNIRQQKGWND